MALTASQRAEQAARGVEAERYDLDALPAEQWPTTPPSPAERDKLRRKRRRRKKEQ